ncbi:RusA family crossover junction endodeoxyribonuclease [Candidatus Poriferisocius sp.]|uniref:RusA family crossover junction endodeoxyribonuclease n=1 Tax=Candidatus Poriferisocius sp. TaxID=3101276 RepID=UPI003B520547
MAHFKVVLPGFPPTTNNLYRSGKRGLRYMSTEYRKWKAGMVPYIQESVETSLPDKTPFCLEIALYGIDRRSDISNRVKAMEDAMVESGVVPDDRWCDRCVVARLKGDGRKETVVYAYTLEDDDGS